MSKLIALVATAVVVGGVRTVIQPGEPLPELSKHDERELLQSGAAENPADTAALAKEDARAAAQTQAEFQAARERALQAARERALQERASINVGDSKEVGAESDSAAASTKVDQTTTASPAPAPVTTAATPAAAPAKATPKTPARK